MFTNAEIDSLRVGVSPHEWSPPEQDRVASPRSGWMQPYSLSPEELTRIEKDLAACFYDQRYWDGLIMSVPDSYDVIRTAGFGVTRLVEDIKTTTRNADPDTSPARISQSDRVFSEVLGEIDTVPFYSGIDAYQIVESSEGHEVSVWRRVSYALAAGRGLVALAGNKLRLSRAQDALEFDAERLAPGKTFNISRVGSGTIERTRIVHASIIIPRPSAKSQV